MSWLTSAFVLHPDVSDRLGCHHRIVLGQDNCMNHRTLLTSKNRLWRYDRGLLDRASHIVLSGDSKLGAGDDLSLFFEIARLN